jgi:Domain of unknown function (DUF1707)
MTERAALRASDADRERIAERLRHAAGEGRLLAEELEERIGAALSAKTYGELDATVADLPRPSVGRRRRSVAGVPLAVVAVAVALLVAVVLIAGAATAVGGHPHPGHHWGGGPRNGASMIWLLVWLAIGVRLLTRRGAR